MLMFTTKTDNDDNDNDDVAVVIVLYQPLIGVGVFLITPLCYLLTLCEMKP